MIAYDTTKIKQIFIIILMISLPLLSFSQKGDKSFREKFLDAEYYFMYEDYYHALPLYLELYQKDSTNANVVYRIGLCYFNLPDPKGKKKAFPYFLKASQRMTNDYNEGSYEENKAPYDALFYLAITYRFLGKYDKAIETFEKFKKTVPIKKTFYIEYVNREIQSTRNAKELMKYKVQVEVIPLDSMLEEGEKTKDLNDPFAYGKMNDTIIRNCPVVSDDEKTVVFTQGSKNKFNLTLEEDVDYQMDSIYFSKKVNGKWTIPENITTELSSHYDKIVPTSLNADGTELYLVIDKNDNGDVYVSKYYDGKWHKAKKLNKHINTRYWESHASISADGKALYFTSDRPGGYGGLDIYVSYKEDDSGDWGPAINLGPTINTKYDEETPFILNDGKTLYFSSQGHYNMGGFDVFHSRKMPNGKWSTPLNLGYPISTVGNDLFYLPKKNGEYAFFALNSNERDIEGTESNNIYALKITPPKNQMTEIIVKGLITLQDNNPNYPQDLAVYVIDTLTNDTIRKIDAYKTNGKYEATLDAGGYELRYKGKGYKEEVKTLFIPEIYTRSEIVINVELIPEEVSKGKYYVIKSILFDYGKYDLRPDALVEIEKLYQLMKDNPSLYVEIVGHTDSWGSKEFNKELSEKRARAVVDYLVSKGISPERFVARGMGEEQPIAINENPDGSDNPQGRQLNRRVEIKIIKSDPSIIVKQEIYVPENLKYQGFTTRSRNEEYTIVVKKSHNKLNFTKIDTIPVKEIKADTMYYYTVGYYKEKSKALRLLNDLVDKGYNDASIMNLAELKNMQNYQAGSISGKQSVSLPQTDKNDKEVYTVQIKALLSPVDISIFKNLDPKKIKEFLGEDGIYRYTYDKVKGRANAEKLLKELVAKGYSDAFIVKYDKYKYDESKYIYTIQIASLDKQTKLSRFKNLKGVKEYIGLDGKFKYVYGKYKSLEDAKKDLKKVRKLGYKDAFVVTRNKFF